MEVNENTENVPLKSQMSEYEKLRKSNIERNEEFLKSLGLPGIVKTKLEKTDSEKKTPRSKPKKRKSFSHEQEEDEIVVEPRRRSRRIQNLEADGEEGAELTYFQDEIVVKKPKTEEREPINITLDEEEGRKRITAPTLRALIQSSSQEHDEEISNEAVTHCAYRMSYMSTHALGTRLKQIAKAAKRNSYEKLLVFYYALYASNLLNLAQTAKEILQSIGVTMPDMAPSTE